MAGAFGDDPSPDAAAGKSEVADEVKDFVAHELIAKAQRAVLYFATADDDGALVGCSADQAHVAQHRLVFAEAEGTRRCDEAAVVAGFEVADEGLVTDGLGKIDGVVDGVAIAGIDADKFCAFANLYGLQDAEVLAFAALALEAGSEDGFDVGQGAAVEDGHFEVVDFDDDVIDAKADERGKQVLRGGDEDALAHEAGGVGDFGDVAAGGRDFKVVEVGTAEDDAGSGGRGDETQYHFSARVQTYATEVEPGVDRLFELGVVGQEAYLGASEVIKTQATCGTLTVRCGFFDTVRWRVRGFVAVVGEL